MAIGEPSADWTLEAPYEGIDRPVQSLIEQGLGLTQHEVYGAALDRKGSIVEDCMNARGFAASPAELPSSAIQNSGSAKVFGGATKVALETLDQIARDRSTTTEAVSHNDDPARSLAIEECYAEARALPDPYQLLNDFLQSELGELEQAVLADARVASADDRSVECFARLGYPAADEAELSDWFVDRANEVLLAAVDQTIGVDQARSQLLDIEAEEDAVEAEATTCFYERDRVHAIVRAEIEQEFINQNSERLRELIDQTRRAVVADYALYLKPNN